MPRHGRRVPVGIDEGDLDVKDAQCLRANHVRCHEGKYEPQRTDHEVIVLLRQEGCQTTPFFEEECGLITSA